jgi:hypothetical protein
MRKNLHLKILLIYLKEEAMTALEVEGYNVSTSSFDIPHQVPKLDCFKSVIADSYFPTPFTKHKMVLADHFLMSHRSAPYEGACLSL